MTFALLQNYPDPFTSSTSIKFTIPVIDQGSATQTRLEIFDAAGRLVATPVNGKLNAGSYHIEWKTDNLASGIYYYKLSAGKFNGIKKMVLAR